MTIEITRLLHKYQCTYNETDEILSLLADEIKQQREDFEYETINDYINGNKTRCVMMKLFNH